MRKYLGSNNGVGSKVGRINTGRIKVWSKVCLMPATFKSTKIDQWKDVHTPTRKNHAQAQARYTGTSRYGIIG
jgi:hypothetical protein